MKYLPAIVCFAIGLAIGDAKALADECQVYRDKGYAVPNSSELSPFSDGVPIDKLTPVEIFRASSGYYCDFPNDHPTIYGHSGDAVTVVGAGYEKTFPLAELDEAFAAYMRLLARQGYFE